MLNATQVKLHEQLRLLKEKHEDQFLGKNGVIGMSVGFKTVKGQTTEELAIRFYVRRQGWRAPDRRAQPVPVPSRNTDAAGARRPGERRRTAKRLAVRR